MSQPHKEPTKKYAIQTILLDQSNKGNIIEAATSVILDKSRQKKKRKKPVSKACSDTPRKRQQRRIRNKRRESMASEKDQSHKNQKRNYSESFSVMERRMKRARQEEVLVTEHNADSVTEPGRVTEPDGDQRFNAINIFVACSVKSLFLFLGKCRKFGVPIYQSMLHNFRSSILAFPHVRRLRRVK